MESVYVLHHTHELDQHEQDIKLIGVYSSPDQAHKAIARLQELPGFRDTKAGFSIDVYKLDRDYWAEGYATA